MNDTPSANLGTKKERVPLDHPVITGLLFDLFGAESAPFNNIRKLLDASQGSEQITDSYAALANGLVHNADKRVALATLLLSENLPDTADKAAMGIYFGKFVNLLNSTFIVGRYKTEASSEMLGWLTPERRKILTDIFDVALLEDGDEEKGLEGRDLTVQLVGDVLGGAIFHERFVVNTDPVAQIIAALGLKPAEGSGGGILRSDGAVDGDAFANAFSDFGNRRQPGDLEDADGKDEEIVG